MVFKRRDKLSLLAQVRGALFPKKGWRRAFEYVVHRIKRLPDTPHKIALGFACGVFVSFSPLFGFHFIYAGLCALLLRGNVLAALLGTFVGNPFTFPLIAAISLHVGGDVMGLGRAGTDFAGIQSAMWNGITGLWHSVLSLVWLSEARWDEVGRFFSRVFFPYLAGGAFPGIVAGGITYWVARPLVGAYQARRRAKFLQRRTAFQAEPAE